MTEEQYSEIFKAKFPSIIDDEVVMSDHPEQSIIIRQERKIEERKIDYFNEIKKMEIVLRYNLRKWEESKELKKKDLDKYKKVITDEGPKLDDMLLMFKNSNLLSYLDKKSIQPAWKRISEYFKYKANNYATLVQLSINLRFIPYGSSLNRKADRSL